MPIQLQKLTHSALFKFFFEQDHPELPFYGLREATIKGIQEVEQYARHHDAWDGQPLPKHWIGKITPEATEIATAMVENQATRARFAQNVMPYFMQRFHVKTDRELFTDPTPSSLPVQPSGAQINLPSASPLHTQAELALVNPALLPELLAQEFSLKKESLEAQAPSERGLQQLAIFKHYADALWQYGEKFETEAVSQQLLDVLEHQPGMSASLLRQDFNGAGWGVAQSIALGIDPNRLDRSFPRAMPATQLTRSHFDDVLWASVRYVDQYLQALGLAPSAEAFQKKSIHSRMLNLGTYMNGQLLADQWGGFKPADVMEEKRPFASTGLNWGLLMFPGDKEIESVPVHPEFEFPIDFLWDSGRKMVYAFPENGDRLKIFNAVDEELALEKVIHRDVDDRASAWSARFVDAAGNEVPPESVTGRIWAAQYDCLQGDGDASLDMDVRWWGRCEQVAAQAICKYKYGIPEFDREWVPVRAGDTVIQVPKADAQKLFDMDVYNLVKQWSYCGFSFRNDMVDVTLKDGTKIEGRLVDHSYIPSSHDSERIKRDRIRVPNSPGSFIGEALQLELVGGTRQTIPGKDIEFVEGATEDDLRISRYIAWIAEQKGVFASDSAIGEAVSNGPRWVNEIEIESRVDDKRPIWAQRHGSKLSGMQGELERIPGDKILWIKGLYVEPENIGQERALDPDNSHIQFSGWAQVNHTGRIVNEGFVFGQQDFGWNAEGPLDWSQPSTVCPQMPPEFRLQLMINGLRDVHQLEALAPDLNLPENWREYRIEPDI